MKEINFSKYHGNGNDFILIDNRKELFPIEDISLIQKLCHRNFGIGADGIILLSFSKKADGKMRIFNSDGSEAASCGNGLGCFTKFIFDLGLKKKKYSIEINKELIESELENNQVTLTMPYPEIYMKKSLVQLGDVSYDFSFIDSGVPHVVIFVPDVSKVNVNEIGRKLRNHFLFAPNGANVNFAEVMKENFIKARTYERGVEDETYACGTGAVAIAIASTIFFGFSGLISVSFKNGTMEVSSDNNNIKLKNNINFVYSGKIPLK